MTAKKTSPTAAMTSSRGRVLRPKPDPKILKLLARISEPDVLPAVRQILTDLKIAPKHKAEVLNSVKKEHIGRPLSDDYLWTRHIYYCAHRMLRTIEYELNYGDPYAEKFAGPQATAKELEALNKRSWRIITSIRDYRTDTYDALEQSIREQNSPLSAQDISDALDVLYRATSKPAAAPPKKSTKDTRPMRNYLESVVTEVVANTYRDLTGRRTGRNYDAIAGKYRPDGFPDFLAQIFDILGIRASPTVRTRRRRKSS